MSYLAASVITQLDLRYVMAFATLLVPVLDSLLQDHPLVSGHILTCGHGAKDLYMRLLGPLHFNLLSVVKAFLIQHLDHEGPCCLHFMLQVEPERKTPAALLGRFPLTAESLFKEIL